MQIGFILGLSLIADFKIQKCNFLSLSPRSSGTGGLGWVWHEQPTLHICDL